MKPDAAGCRSLLWAENTCPHGSAALRPPGYTPKRLRIGGIPLGARSALCTKFGREWEATEIQQGNSGDKIGIG